MTCTQMSQEEDSSPLLRYEPCCTGYKCIYLSVALSVVAIVLTIVGVSLGIVQVSWLAGHITGNSLHSDSVFTNIINVEKEAHIGNLTSSKKRDLGQDSSPRFAFYVNVSHIIHSVETFFSEYAFFKDAAFKKAIFEELNSQKAYIKELEVKILQLEDVNANKVETNILEVFESVLLANGVDLEVLGDLTADYGFFNFQVQSLLGVFNIVNGDLIQAVSGNFTSGLSTRNREVEVCDPRYNSTATIEIFDGTGAFPTNTYTITIFVKECDEEVRLFVDDFQIETYMAVSLLTRITFNEPFCTRISHTMSIIMGGLTAGVDPDIDVSVSLISGVSNFCRFQSIQSVAQVLSSFVILPLDIPVENLSKQIVGY